MSKTTSSKKTAGFELIIIDKTVKNTLSLFRLSENIVTFAKFYTRDADIY